MIPNVSGIRRPALRTIVTGTILFCVVICVLLALENSLVYHPLTAAEAWVDPVDARTQDVWLSTGDGATIHGWWLAPEIPHHGAVLLAHGNGSNLSHRGPKAADIRRVMGCGVLMFDYPGYGKSPGKPNEPGCYAAGQAGYRYLTEMASIPPGRVILMGESLGGGVAVELATRLEHRALVLIYTFTSLPAAAKNQFPFLPTHTFMRNRFDNLAKIGRCPRPVFVVHGTADAVVPFELGATLFAAANEPKQFVPLEGAGHWLPDDHQVWETLAAFLRTSAP